MINTLPNTHHNEVWKQSTIKEWIYVSNLGRVWSMKGKGVGVGGVIKLVKEKKK